LTVLVSTLLLQVVASYAAQTMARGSSVTTVDTVNMVLVSVVVFLVMRQVMPLAAGLANGVALSSFGTVSRLVGWGLSAPRRIAERVLG
jgi:type IV secretion system protein VirB6